MIKDSVLKLIEKKDLTREESYACVMEIMSGKSSESHISSFLTSLKMKGETTEEIVGAALAMKEMSTPVVSIRQDLVDTCGTGGDGLGTFNISTTAAIIASAAGAAVAKHGNKAVSSKCGSADVLKELGVEIDVSSKVMSDCLNEIGIAFLFAPVLHSAMKYAAPVRKELGFRTIFNILGPLTNPAGAKRQLLGVYDPALTERLGSVLLQLGSERAFIVHGAGGLDEISTHGETKITELKNGMISTYSFSSDTVGITNSDLRHIAGGNVERNAEIVLSVLNGKKGAPRDIAILNAAAALYISGKSSSIAGGVLLAAEAIDSGAAIKKLNHLIEFTH